MPQPGAASYDVTIDRGPVRAGHLYEARDSTGTVVWLKVLEPGRHPFGGTLSWPEAVAETRRLTRLAQDGAPNLLEVIEEEGNTILVMSAPAGVPLGAALEGTQSAHRALLPRDRDDLRERLLEVLAQLADAHAHGVLHRNLDAQSIRLLPDRRFALAGFSLASLARGELVGAPEVAGGAPGDERSDLHGVAVLFRSLADRLGLSGADALRRLLARGAAPDPELRFADVAHMEEQVRALGVHAKPPPRPLPPPRPPAVAPVPSLPPRPPTPPSGRSRAGK
jgi:hypothetical protein